MIKEINNSTESYILRDVLKVRHLSKNRREVFSKRKKSKKVFCSYETNKLSVLIDYY